MKEFKNHTFVVCAYKQSEYLEECIQSLKKQNVQSNIIISTSTPNEYITNIAKKYDLPVYINDGETKRLCLIEKKIFIPQYWKEVKDRVGKETVEYEFATNILWLPCDQRYNLDDMEYLIDEVKKII